MANVTWDSFHPYVTTQLQGCPIGLVNHALRQATIDFCTRSNLWTMGSTGADLLENQATYTFAPPSGARVTAPRWVSVDSKLLCPVTPRELDRNVNQWRELKEEFPKWYFVEQPNTIRVVGIPTETKANAIDAEVSLCPTRDATGCPDWIYENWAEVIGSGALSILLAMVGKVWSNIELANYHTNLFRAGISRAKSKHDKARQDISLSMVPQPFGGTTYGH